MAFLHLHPKGVKIGAQRPVGNNRKLGDSAEFRLIGGQQGQVQGNGAGGDPQVIGSDRFVRLPQLGKRLRLFPGSRPHVTVSSMTLLGHSGQTWKLESGSPIARTPTSCVRMRGHRLLIDIRVRRGGCEFAQAGGRGRGRRRSRSTTVKCPSKGTAPTSPARISPASVGHRGSNLR